MSDQEKENKEFKVTDRRHFHSDGSEKEEKELDSPSPHEVPEGFDPSSETKMPELTFANFILSLASSAQMQLGLTPNPFVGKIEKNLLQAKQTIDLLGLLAEKTKGNLQKEEDQLLQVILSDLRIRFVEEKTK